MKDYLRKSPTIHIITFSGAHSTGKSTLIADIKKKLEDHDHCKVFVIPSCSSAWAKKKGITDYNDINRLNLRREMQLALPTMLKNFIIDQVEADEVMLGENNKFILCDRWFGDIRTYSKLELGDGYKDLDHDLNKASAELFSALIEHSYYYGGSMSVTHAFIPVGSCQHLLQTGDNGGKFRATMSHQSWEEAYNEVGSTHTPPERTQIVSASDRHQRTEEIIDRIRKLHCLGVDA